MSVLVTTNEINTKINSNRIFKFSESPETGRHRNNIKTRQPSSTQNSRKTPTSQSIYKHHKHYIASVTCRFYYCCHNNTLTETHIQSYTILRANMGQENASKKYSE